MADAGCPDWDVIIEQHSERVFHTALRMLGSVQDAEDVSQDVFVEAFRQHQKTPVENWTAFLVRMTTLRSIDRLRQQRSVLELRESDKLTTVGPVDEATANELADWLRHSLTQLTDQQAAVFVMVHFEGLSRAEVGKNLGMSTQAISTSLYKARQRLLARMAVIDTGDEL